MRKTVTCGVLCFGIGIGQAASIAGSRASTSWATVNLEERSKRELKLAKRALRSARLAYQAGDMAASVASVLALERSVDQAYEFLVETGENPRARPEYFKQAEIQLRHLCRRIEYFQSQMSYEDRTVLEAVKIQIQQVQHELLSGIVSGTLDRPQWHASR